ncbi:MAG: glycosyltransferase family 2 protein, partial [Myxococcota bacterium]
MTSPTVTAVIPTRNRPQEVRAAVRSALAQTLRDLEVVVVLDGPDPATVDALGALSDPRLRWIEHPESRGANAARGSGIAAARASWVALLDDDDEWLPHKLDVQLARAARECEPPIVACGMELRLANGSYVVPRRPRAPDEPLSEYLFCRRGWKKREGVLQT